MSLFNEHSSDAFGPFQGSPKTMFFLGLFAGIAACSLVVLGLLISSISSGKGLLALAGGSGGSGEAAPSPTPSPSPTQAPEPSGGPVKAVNEKSDHILGARNAKVTLIEYSDFQCPYCTRHVPTVKQILKEYPNDVRLVYRHFPLTSIHPMAQKLAEGSECAAEQGGNNAFWAYHDKIFELMANANARDTLSLDTLPSVAKNLGLNETKFKSCLDSGKMAARVSQDAQDGSAAGVQGTPATFVNGKLVSGALPYAQFKPLIDASLKK